MLPQFLVQVAWLLEYSALHHSSIPALHHPSIPALHHPASLPCSIPVPLPCTIPASLTCSNPAPRPQALVHLLDTGRNQSSWNLPLMDEAMKTLSKFSVIHSHCIFIFGVKCPYTQNILRDSFQETGNNYCISPDSKWSNKWSLMSSQHKALDTCCRRGRNVSISLITGVASLIFQNSHVMQL